VGGPDGELTLVGCQAVVPEGATVPAGGRLPQDEG